MRDIYIILQEPRGIVHRIVNNQGGWRVKGEVDREGKVGKGFLFFFFFCSNNKYSNIRSANWVNFEDDFCCVHKYVQEKVVKNSLP